MKPEKSSRVWAFRIQDILHAIEKIERFTAGMSLSEFKKNVLVIDAVVRNFEIIGEASNAIPPSVRDAHPQIPWKPIIGLRNLLIHEYFGVDLDTVWETLQVHLPNLKQQLENLTADGRTL